MVEQLNDPDLRHELRRARRLAAAAALLESPPPLEALPVRCLSVDKTSVLHASRSRPVVRWDLTVQDRAGRRSPLPVVGKGFTAGGGLEAWWLLRRLHELGFDDAVLRVPQPYGYDPTRRLLAQEVAPAGSLHDLIDGNLRASTQAVRRVARWLARLHAVTGVVGVPTLAADFETTKLGGYALALSEVLPAAASRISDLTGATLAKVADAATDPPVLTHGDFQPKNVHLDSSRVVVIDFDRAALAPAARDLGHFLGQTITMVAAAHGDLETASPWTAAFLEEYVASGGDPRAVRSTAGYVARTFAEVLHYRLVVRPVRSRSFVPAWLAAWERHLDAEALS